MPQSAYDRQKKWQPSANAMLAFFPTGENAEYFIANPAKMFGSRDHILKLFDSLAGINSKDGLKAYIRWRIQEGVRFPFDKLYRELEWLSQAERVLRLKTDKQKEQLAVINRYLQRLPSGGIAALDATYIVFFSMAGKRLEWLTDEEVWDYVGSAIRITQKRYRSWHEYCAGFVAGLEYANPADNDCRKERERRLRRLLTFPDSPLKKDTLLFRGAKSEEKVKGN
jgi:hypothetical protein